MINKISYNLNECSKDGIDYIYTYEPKPKPS